MASKYARPYSKAESGRDELALAEMPSSTELSEQARMLFRWVLEEGTAIEGTHFSGTRFTDWFEQLPEIRETASTRMLPSLQVGLQEFVQLSSDVKALLREVRDLRAELANRPLAFSVRLGTLNDKRVLVRNPVSVIVEETDEECLARWPEVNAYGLGATLSESILDLKRNIVDLYLDLTGRDPDTLGGLALETLSTLQSYLDRGG